MIAQHNANMSNFNLQQQMQQNQQKMQSALNLDAMQRQHEMQFGGQEKMQQMQFEMQQKQMNIQLNDQNEKMRIQREEMQRASRLSTESKFIDAHKANLNAQTVNNAMDNGYNPYEWQNNPMNMNAGMQQPMNQPMNAGMQQPMMGGMMGQKTMMDGMLPNVNDMVAVNGQQAGPYNWMQLQQLVQAGQLTRETFVVTNGMTAWLPAGQVQELLPLFQGMAPSMPGMPQMM